MARARHPSLEDLHAYAAGEVDPARRAACAAHLEGCPDCRRDLARVRGLQAIMRDSGPEEPDDLSWRRLQMRVRTQLQAEANGGPSTQDLVLRSRWTTAGVVAVVAVALMVLFMHERETTEPPIAEVDRPDGVRQVLAREAPVDLTLRSGAELSLDARGRLEVRPGPGPTATLVLSTGTLSVRDLRPPAVGRPIRVEVSPYTLEATHADFRVERLARGAAVAVSRGEVRVVSDDGASAPRRLVAGERAAFPEAPPPSAEPAPAASAQAEPERRAPSARRARPSAPTVAEPAPAASPEGPAPGSGPRPGPGAPLAGSSAQKEVSVSIEAPADPTDSRLGAARRAYYERGDLARAAELAGAVRADAASRADVQAALELLCQAYTAMSRSDEAVEACGALLDTRLGEGRRRVLHKQLADIHREQRSDCVAALEHYSRVLVFGQSTPLDDDARLSRADCALRVGDVTLAERDLAQLEASRAFRRHGALQRLRDRLSAIRPTQDRGSGSDRR